MGIDTKIDWLTDWLTVSRNVTDSELAEENWEFSCGIFAGKEETDYGKQKNVQC
jgi:hypothetical protein